ncbi:DNA oxidative demethylase ALKBH2-like [Daktulosphaira vitifoliae]|uniref:DNA oxidative demethylase ALKBH2-like n=1 Tax=Daktulosphaira vitifoliae TaxID=58002 RepID=UPI0021AA9BEE|nr:DNA oxidative demethylase ALKBH2-like [Daktulosphaira vitifoliae]
MSLYDKMMKDKQTRWKKITAENIDLDYCEQFLTSIEASSLLEYMEKNITYLNGRLTYVKVFGVYHPIPRQQVAFGDDGVTYKYSGIIIPAQPWPKPLLELKNKISFEQKIDYNFVLVNRYKNGDDYMGEHKDDEPELDKMVPIASLSLGQSRKFVFKHRDVKKKLRKIDNINFHLHHGSLLFMNWPTNEYWYHSLPKEKAATKVRINLTFRKIK